MDNGLSRPWYRMLFLGIGLRQLVDGRILVSFVDEGSPAKKASKFVTVFQLSYFSYPESEGRFYDTEMPCLYRELC